MKVDQFAAGFTPLMERADAGGSGAADPGGAGDGSQPSGAGTEVVDAGGEGAADGHDAVGEDALEDLLTDDDDPTEDETGRTRTPEDRLKAVAKKNRKLRKQLAKLLPLGKRLQGVDLDDLMTRARNYDSLDRTIRANPKLRARIYGGDADEEPTTRRLAPVADPGFDESTLPFDANETPTNRYFADLAKANHELNLTVKQLAGRLDTVDGRDTQRTERDEKSRWDAAENAAMARIKLKSVRTTFHDSLIGAFTSRAAHGRSPQFVIDHYLKQYEEDGLLTPQEAAKAGAAAAAAAGTPPAAAAPSRAAAQQRIAEGNRGLPRTVAPPGSPAPARTGRESLADVNKRIRRLA